MSTDAAPSTLEANPMVTTEGKHKVEHKVETKVSTTAAEDAPTPAAAAAFKTLFPAKTTKTPLRANIDLAANILFMLTCLYFFLVGLGLMGDSFKVLAGKSAGNLFQAADHPIAGLMVGILATVLVQSSSTSTSIVVGLVGSGVMPVRQAIFVIMGANIGTSVTNTIVSLGHASDPDEYERAFAGATVHDMFNFLNVLVMLPLEWIVGAVTGSGGPLYWLSYSLTAGLKEMAGGKFTSPVSVIIKPLHNAILKPDKDKIKALAMGMPTNTTCLSENGKGVVVAKVDYYICGNQTIYEKSIKTWNDKIINGVLTKGGAFKGMSDDLAGGLGLAISLFVLCLALFLLVVTLKRLFLGRAKSCIGKAVNMNGYLAILVGAGMTIAVQSSSIITSALTPLVGIGTLPLDKMLPLTLGANIGTTCTALLASMVISTEAAIQIALCHLFFNIAGILVWYPIPAMRNMPLRAAKWMGHMTVALPWWPIAYIAFAFFFVPLLLLGLSTMVTNGDTVLTVFGWMIISILILFALGVGFWMKFKGGYEKMGALLDAKREIQRIRMMDGVRSKNAAVNKGVANLQQMGGGASKKETELAERNLV